MPRLLYARLAPLLCLLGWLAWLQPAAAQGRIALIVTNQNYTQPGARLAFPHRDGDLIKAALEKVGFKVWHVRDTRTEGELLRAIAGHVERVSSAGPEAVGFLYYSGHGAADRPDGANYLIPTDAPLTSAAQLDLVGVRLDRVIGSLSKAGRMSFVVFDACRNVPLIRDTRDASFRGFAPVREQNGLLVAFATDPGNTAIDENLFSQALAEELVRPGLEAAQVFRRVRQRVREGTAGRQLPEYIDKREHDFHFAMAPSGTVPAPAAPLPAPSAEPPVAMSPLPSPAPAPPRPTPAPAPVAIQPSAPCDGAWVAAGGAPRCMKPGSGQAFRDCPTCPEMVVLPGGGFMMGSSAAEITALRNEYQWFRLYWGQEGPQRNVRFSAPLAVGKHEVTFSEWEACVADGGCNHRAIARWGRDRHPVYNVAWQDAQEYVGWLSRKTGQTYRLLTEAEWEYAARAGTTTRYHFGRTISQQQARFSTGVVGTLRTAGSQGTLPVGSFPANAWGLHDMHGNVAEWVEDCFKDSYDNAPADGSAVDTGASCRRRVHRGGSWSTVQTELLRSANRNSATPGSRSDGSEVRPEVPSDAIGFRVARVLPRL